MGSLLFIDSDDIGELSDALRKALEKRGIVFCGNEEIPSDTDIFVDDAPMPSGCGSTRHYDSSHCGLWRDGGCGLWVGGHCGYSGC